LLTEGVSWATPFPFRAVRPKVIQAIYVLIALMRLIPDRRIERAIQR